MTGVLSCTVRDCYLVLQPGARTLRCARGHAFDVARTGYVNLLQPQDRRSPAAGDALAAVEARARIVAAAPGRAILESVAGRAAALPFAEGASVVDLGCGSGELLDALAGMRRVDAIGIDLSTSAIDRAARNFPEHTWVVANADRRLPILDRSAAVVVSLHGRRNPSECARILTRDGRLLIGVPAPDDLSELRAAVQGEASVRERGDAVVEAHREHFTLLDRWIVRRTMDADHARLIDLLCATYRGFRPRQLERARALPRMDVTLATELFLFGLLPGAVRPLDVSL